MMTYAVFVSGSVSWTGVLPACSIACRVSDGIVVIRSLLRPIIGGSGTAVFAGISTHRLLRFVRPIERVAEHDRERGRGKGGCDAWAVRSLRPFRGNLDLEQSGGDALLCGDRDPGKSRTSPE